MMYTLFGFVHQFGQENFKSILRQKNEYNSVTKSLPIYNIIKIVSNKAWYAQKIFERLLTSYTPLLSPQFSTSHLQKINHGPKTFPTDPSDTRTTQQDEGWTKVYHKYHRKRKTKSQFIQKARQPNEVAQHFQDFKPYSLLASGEDEEHDSTTMCSVGKNSPTSRKHLRYVSTQNSSEHITPKGNISRKQAVNMTTTKRKATEDKTPHTRNKRKSTTRRTRTHVPTSISFPITSTSGIKTDSTHTAEQKVLNIWTKKSCVLHSSSYSNPDNYNQVSPILKSKPSYSSTKVTTNISIPFTLQRPEEQREASTKKSEQGRTSHTTLQSLHLHRVIANYRLRRHRLTLLKSYLQKKKHKIKLQSFLLRSRNKRRHAMYE